MVDFHTHILPGMDDGSASAQDSLALLRMQREQGVDTVVLSSHFYRERESIQTFINRRNQSMAQLRAAIADLPDGDTLPKLLVAAEVAWRPNIEQWSELDRLCIGDTKILLLELPCEPWYDVIFDSMYNLINKGVTPLLAHLERYFSLQRKAVLEQVMSIGIPIQISTDVLLPRFFGRRFIRLLARHSNMVLGSDCHNTTLRPPNMGQAVARLEQRLGEDATREILLRGDRLLEN